MEPIRGSMQGLRGKMPTLCSDAIWKSSWTVHKKAIGAWVEAWAVFLAKAASDADRVTQQPCCACSSQVIDLLRG